MLGRGSNWQRRLSWHAPFLFGPVRHRFSKIRAAPTRFCHYSVRARLCTLCWLLICLTFTHAPWKGDNSDALMCHALFLFGFCCRQVTACRCVCTSLQRSCIVCVLALRVCVCVVRMRVFENFLLAAPETSTMVVRTYVRTYSSTYPPYLCIVCVCGWMVVWLMKVREKRQVEQQSGRA